MVLEHRSGANAGIAEGPGRPGGERPPESLERLRYFPRQLLTPADLTQEQDYFRARRRRHNRLLHGWGIVGGCAVRPGTGNWTVLVEPGLVFSPQGDEIYIENPLQVDLSRQTPDGYVATSTSRPGDPGYGRVTFNPGTILYLVVAYAEFPARPVRAQPLGAEDTARFEYSRVRDGFILRVHDGLPPSAAQEPPAAPFTCTAGQVRPYPAYPADPWVVLARITIAAPQIRDADIDLGSDRRYVASYGDWWFRCGDGRGSTSAPPIMPPRVQAVRLLYTRGDPTAADPVVLAELADPAQPWRVEDAPAWPNALEFQFGGPAVDFAAIALGTHLLAPGIRQARLVPMLATNSLRLAGIFTPREYTVTLRGDEPAIRSTDGQRLDGEPVRLPSGDGTAGGNFSFRVRLIAGHDQPPPPKVETIRLLRTRTDPAEPNPAMLAEIRQVTPAPRVTVPADHWPNAIEVEFGTAAVDLEAIQAGTQVTLSGLRRFELVRLADSNSLRLIGELQPGAYTLTLRGTDPAIQSLEGHPLDGEPAQLPSGDGTAGGNFVLPFEIVAAAGQPAAPRVQSVRIVRTGLAPTNLSPEPLFAMQDPHQPIRLAVPLSAEAQAAQTRAQSLAPLSALPADLDIVEEDLRPIPGEWENLIQFGSFMNTVRLDWLPSASHDVDRARRILEACHNLVASAQSWSEHAVQLGNRLREMITWIEQAQRTLNAAPGWQDVRNAQELVARAIEQIGPVRELVAAVLAEAQTAATQAAQMLAQAAPDAIDIEFSGATIDQSSIVLGSTCLVDGPFSRPPQVVPLSGNVVRIFAPMESRQGTYSVTLRGDEPAIRSAQGRRLDGEPAQLPSGDGTEGGDFTFSFELLPG